MARGFAAGDARCVQRGSGAVRRVLLGEAAEIEFHAGPLQRHGFAVPIGQRPAHVRQQGVHGFSGRHPARLEIPDPAKDARRDVEAAIAGLVELVGKAE